MDLVCCLTLLLTFSCQSILLLSMATISHFSWWPLFSFSWKRKIKQRRTAICFLDQIYSYPHSLWIHQLSLLSSCDNLSFVMSKEHYSAVQLNSIPFCLCKVVDNKIIFFLNMEFSSLLYLSHHKTYILIPILYLLLHFSAPPQGSIDIHYHLYSPPIISSTLSIQHCVSLCPLELWLQMFTKDLRITIVSVIIVLIFLVTFDIVGHILLELLSLLRFWATELFWFSIYCLGHSFPVSFNFLSLSIKLGYTQSAIFKLYLISIYTVPFGEFT